MRGFAAAVVCSSLALGGCGSEDGTQGGEEVRDEDLGTATFQLMAVPSGVGCLRISVSGSASVSRDFSNLMSGAATTSLSMNRLPLGAVAISGLAYASTCGSGDPIYIADTTSAVLAAGVVSELPLTFRKNNPVTANVSFVGNVQALSASGFETSAIVDGVFYSWGNGAGGVPAPVWDFPASVGLSGGSVARGWCSLTAQGSLKCFGANNGNMFGPGGGWVSGATYGGAGKYVSAALGDVAMCAASPSTKSVYCSGRNSAGQLGAAVPPAGTSTPVVTWSNGVASLTAGFEHFCLVDGALQVQCIGKNDAGQLGDGTTVNRSSWVLALRGASTVSAGASHTCALMTDGTVKCWGNNPLGQVGDATTTTRLSPVAVGGIVGATKLAVGAVHGCVLLGDGTVKCWGSNANGALGDGTVKDRLTAVQVPLPEAAVDISAGSSHTCALTKRQDIYCWGNNSAGELGNGSYVNSAKPVRVVLP
jgi:hypothetical protein